MRIGLIQDGGRVLGDETPVPAQQRIAEVVEEAVFADEMGFDFFGLAEVHFSEVMTMSAPDVVLATIAARTERIRLRFVSTPLLAFNHPVRVAERAATLDILSNGRLDLGTGRGASWYHTEAFGVSIEQSRDVWDEALRVICGLFVSDTFPGHKGRYYEVPERKLVPKPVQKPHPPLWVAATNQATFTSAARAGLGVLGFTAVPPEELAPAVAAYRAAQADAARVVIGRIQLERFRESGANEDLDSARESLRLVDPRGLDVEERVELTIGLAEALYFEHRYSAAERSPCGRPNRSVALPHSRRCRRSWLEPPEGRWSMPHSPRLTGLVVILLLGLFPRAASGQG